jgi:hypothetical protein
MKTRHYQPEHNESFVDARGEARDADVHLTVALIAHVAASRTAFDLADDDTRHCVLEAHSRYRDAAWHYLNAAHRAHGRWSRPGHYDLLGLPHALRSTLRPNVAGLPHCGPRAMAKATASIELDRLQAAVTVIRAQLVAALPDLLLGRDHPQLRLEQLRTASVPARACPKSLVVQS